MFSFISMNWRGRPLTSYRTVIELISATNGLAIRAGRDAEWCQKGVKIADTELAALDITGHDWHPNWNYTIMSVDSTGSPHR